MDNMEIDANKYYEYHVSQSTLSSTIESCWWIFDIIGTNYFSSASNINNKRTIFNTLPGGEANKLTLYGIKALLTTGNIVDSFVLLRKFRDNIFLDLYLISKDRTAYEKKIESISKLFDIADTDSIDQLIKNLSSDDEDVQNWFQDKFINEQKKRIRRQIIGYSNFVKAIKGSNKSIEQLYSRFFDELLSIMDNRLENYVHSNGFTVISNEILSHPKERLCSIIKSIDRLITDLLIVYISTIILLNSTLLQSSDYVDALDMEERPINDSQYWIAPGISDFIKDNIKDINTDLFEYIKSCDNYSMKLDE